MNPSPTPISRIDSGPQAKSLTDMTSITFARSLIRRFEDSLESVRKELIGSVVGGLQVDVQIVAGAQKKRHR